MFLYKLPIVVGSLLAIFVSIAIVGLVFVLGRRFFPDDRSEGTRALSQRIGRSVGVFNALIVGLVFSILTSEYLQLQKMVDSEAGAAGFIYSTLADIETEASRNIRNLISEYLREVTDVEWALQAQGKTSPKVDRLMQTLLVAARDWEPGDINEKAVRQNVLDKLEFMRSSFYRRLFVVHTGPAIPGIFWTITVFGFIVSILTNVSFRLNTHRFVLISSYASVVGLTFYGILLMSNPFVSGIVSPSPFKVAYERTIEVSEERKAQETSLLHDKQASQSGENNQ